MYVFNTSHNKNELCKAKDTNYDLKNHGQRLTNIMGKKWHQHRSWS